MKSKQLRKILLSSLLSVGVLASSTLPVFADVQSPADPLQAGGQTIESTQTQNQSVTIPKKDDNGKGYGTVDSNLTIKAKATNVNVTVPTTVPFEFDENGDTRVPNNFQVTNNSAIAGVYLESITLDAKNHGWKVVKDGFDLAKMPVDTQNVRIKFGKDGSEKLIAPEGGANESAKGVATFNSGDIDIEAKDTQKLTFKVDRGAFSKDVVEATAFDMTLQFRFQ